MGNAAPQEIIYLSVGLVAGTVNIILAIFAQGDLRDVFRRRLNGGMRIEAWTGLISQGALALQQLMSVTLGVLAVLSPPANPENPTTKLGIYFAIGFILKQFLAAFQGLFLLWRRNVLREYLEKEAEAIIATNEQVAQQRHDESMSELVHNTEVTEDTNRISIAARLDTIERTNNINDRIVSVQRDIANTNRVAGEAADKLREVIERHEEGRKEREGS